MKETLIAIHISTGRVITPKLVRRIDEQCAHAEKHGYAQAWLNAVKKIYGGTIPS